MKQMHKIRRFDHKNTVIFQQEFYPCGQRFEIIYMSENIAAGYDFRFSIFLADLVRQLFAEKFRKCFDAIFIGDGGNIFCRVNA